MADPRALSPRTGLPDRVRSAEELAAAFPLGQSPATVSAYRRDSRLRRVRGRPRRRRARRPPRPRRRLRASPGRPRRKRRDDRAAARVLVGLLGIDLATEQKCGASVSGSWGAEGPVRASRVRGQLVSDLLRESCEQQFEQETEAAIELVEVLSGERLDRETVHERTDQDHEVLCRWVGDTGTFE